MPGDGAKSAAAERQRRRRERRRRGERVAPAPYDDSLIEALIEGGLLVAWNADDPNKVGEAIVKAAWKGVINVCFRAQTGH